MKIIMLIDVNNAFLSWEAIYLLNNGCKYDIRNSYAVVGGSESERRGIVLAKSNPAKKLGIKTAETINEAKKKCRVLRVYPPHYQFYYEMSNKLMNLIKTYTPDIEIASVDECYIDYTPIMYLQGDYLEFAKKLQNQIKDELGFTVNIGIGNNKLCAKMASDFSKPFKIHTLFMEEVKDKMHPLPVEDLFGIGKKTYPKLYELGIKTIGDLANSDMYQLTKIFKNQTSKIIDLANGIGSSKIEKDTEYKGISSSVTLIKDTDNINEINKVLKRLSEKLGIEIRKKKQYAYVIASFYKNDSFITKSHQKKLFNPTDNTSIIYETAKSLMNEIVKGETVRLVGVRLDKLVEVKKEQLSMFDQTKKDNDDVLEKTIDLLKEKYGNNIIK